ncbi:MAG: hypothetical protein N2441_06940 [Rhodocyclaceae bacterium]|nr:hypothetical protein [Rhodocyclaceae bacterium]
MIDVELFPYRLPLIRPWRAAHKTLSVRQGALVRLRDAEGHEGWGDCAPLPSRDDPGGVVAALSAWCRTPKTTALADLPPEARWAIEIAQADLAARQRGLALWRHLGGQHGVVSTNAAVGPLSGDIDERLRAARAQGYAIAKIKVGLGPVEEEIASLRGLAYAGLSLRLDANRAWTDREAERFLTAIRNLPIDAVEEPFAQPATHKFAALQPRLPYALAIDESLLDLTFQALASPPAARRWVVKPARLGSLAAIRVLQRMAQASGVEIVFTTVVDSAIGVTAVAHLAAALAPVSVHGLATSAWLASDVAPFLRVESGRILLGEAPGLGVTPSLPLPQ